MKQLYKKKCSCQHNPIPESTIKSVHFKLTILFLDSGLIWNIVFHLFLDKAKRTQNITHYIRSHNVYHLVTIASSYSIPSVCNETQTAHA